VSKQKTLGSLYPFLQPDLKDSRRLESELLESVRLKSQDSTQVTQTFFAEESEKVVAVAKAIADIYRNNGRLFTMGNGGSSCDAAHIAVEFLHPVTTGRPALPAVNLAQDQAMMTAVGNDVGFDHIFVRQLIAQGKAGDGVIGISTSGNSENIMRTFVKAKEMGLTTIGLTGGAGGAMATSSSLDHCLIVPTESIHRIQECHVLIYHILWDLVHTLLADHRGSSATKKDSL
jgi:D-sedoheptulose 7-phosphate isomerase